MIVYLGGSLSLLFLFIAFAAIYSWWARIILVVLVLIGIAFVSALSSPQFHHP